MTGDPLNLQSGHNTKKRQKKKKETDIKTNETGLIPENWKTSPIRAFIFVKNIKLLFLCNEAFILLFTSQFTIVNNNLFALDTTLRTLIISYKLLI